jgi:NAD-reducing hydrogenase small subunit
MSFLDLDERLLDLAAMADVVFTPIADVKDFPADVDVTLVEGAVASEDHLEMLQRIRERSRVVVAALGDCAVTGNVTALRNVCPVDVVLRNSFGDSPPREPGIVRQLTRRVAPLHHVCAHRRNHSRMPAGRRSHLGGVAGARARRAGAHARWTGRTLRLR